MDRAPVHLIVGAGLAGLAAAATLARTGAPCLLLEKDDRVGGMARSMVMDKITFDMGPHVLFKRPGPAWEMAAKALEGEPVHSRPFAFGVHAEGRYWKFPNHFDIFTYPWKYKANALRAMFSKNGRLLTAEDELRSKTGPLLYDLLFRDTLRKKAGMDPTQIHRHWLMRPDRTALNTLEPPPEKSALQTVGHALKRLNRNCVYPASGFGALADKLHEMYEKAGGETALDCGGIRFDTTGDSIANVQMGGRSIPVRSVIWTAPPRQLGKALGIDLPSLLFKDIVLTLLTYEQPAPVARPFVYVYHPDPNLNFNRISYPASLLPEEAERARREGLCLEITMDPGAADSAVADAAEEGIAGVSRLGLHPASRLRAMRAVRLRDALPVYPMDYQERMAETYRPLRRFKNLRVAGRQGGFFFCMSPEALSQGIKAAADILRLGEERA